MELLKKTVWWLLSLPSVACFSTAWLNPSTVNGLATTQTFGSRSITNLASSFLDGDGANREESQMNSYVNKFLGKEEKNTANQKSYILALPCDKLHELQIELESVQRAIVYNCPVAVHACIPTSGTRIPLLKITGDVSIDHLKGILSNALKTAYNDMPSFQFAGLEIEPGQISNNEVLHAGISDEMESEEPQSSVKELAKVLNRSILDETSCKTSIVENFRLPFMQLPPDWNELVSSQNATANDFTPEFGGNGISPLHWIEWSQDLFGEPQRMREIGLYHADGKFPIATIPFPGNSVRNENELKWEKYQDDRMKEVERNLMGKPSDASERDELMLKLTRQRLEKIYETSENDGSNEEMQEEIPTEEGWEDIQEELLEDPQRESDPNLVDDWTRERIRTIIEAKSTAKAALRTMKKDKPSIEENEIFAKYRRGEMKSILEDPAPNTILSPFPSREHCTGIWKMNTSPTGFPVEEGAENVSDNIILRLDGTIAGGPILDQETRQKASGGVWDFEFPEGGSGELEIRLVIPPKKERILVMQGKLTRPGELPLAGKTFGIPVVDNKAKVAYAKDKDIIDCYGKVWIEDAITKRNRNDIGEFSMSKISDLLDPKQYTITIPKNVRSLD